MFIIIIFIIAIMISMRSTYKNTVKTLHQKKSGTSSLEGKEAKVHRERPWMGPSPRPTAPVLS